MTDSSSSSSSSESESEESSSPSQEEEPEMEQDDEPEESPAPNKETPQSPATMEAPTLSRSWSVETAHSPIFTGGKVARGNAFLLLPVGGDVALVDADKGIQIGSIRGRETSGMGDNDEDEDDDGIDADAITAYALSPNDRMIVTCSHNTLLRQYSVNSTALNKADESSAEDTPELVQCVKTWGKSGHTLPVTELEFHSSGVFCATGSVDGSVRVWDVRGPHMTHSFRPLAAGYEGGGSGTLAITGLKWMADTVSLQLAVARDDGSVAIHDLRQEAPVAVLRDHVSAVTCMDWNENRNLFVTTGRDAVVNLWRVTTTKSKKKKKKNSKKKDSALEEEITYSRLHTLPIYEQVEGMVILPPTQERDDLVVATAGTKGCVRLWQANATESSPRLKLMAEQPESEAFGESRGGYTNLCYNPYAQGETDSFVQEQLIAADAEHNISFLSLGAKKELATERTVVGHNDDILDLKIVPTLTGEPSQIVVATNSAQVRIFDLRNFSCQVLDRHTATVLCVDVSPCGRFIATCGKDKQMRIWNQEKSVALATGHTEAIGSVAFSKKAGRYQVRGKAATNGGGSFCVTVSIDRTLKRWNLPGADDLVNIAERLDEEMALTAFLSTRAHDKDINIVSVAPNDSYIATGSQDKTVKLWKATDLSLVATLKGHRRGVWDCQFSPYDRVLATGSGDKTIKLWSLSDFSCVRTFQGHIASVLRVRFLSGGLQLVSSGADGLLKLWTVRSNECEATMDRHDDKVWALDLAGNSKTMVSGGADSQIFVWKDTTKEEEAAKVAEEEEAILLDQKLANHLRHKEYKEALNISLERDKPHQALKVLTAIIEGDLQKGRSGLESLQLYAKDWPEEHLLKVLKYCREWNTRARNCTVALLTVKAIVMTVRADTLSSMDGVPEILAGILPYAERHFDRLDRLHASSYLLDFVLFSMGSVENEKDRVEYAAWETTSRLVLPPKEIDGRVQVGGAAMVGRYQPSAVIDESDSDVVTVGEESDSDDNMSDSS